MSKKEPAYRRVKTYKDQKYAGQKFYRLTAIEIDASKPKGRTFWIFRCDCGAIRSMPICRVIAGKIKSCGCYSADIARERATKHGLVDVPEYSNYNNMLQRCRNPNNHKWDNYGGRGISICPRWLESFAYFYHDMGSKPSPQHSLDRIDNEGNYEPENCRWATDKQQANNRRKRRSKTELETAS